MRGVIQLRGARKSCCETLRSGSDTAGGRSVGVTALLVTEVFPPKPGGSGRLFWELYRRLPRESVIVGAGEHPGWEAFDEMHELRLVRLPLKLQSWGCIGVPQLSAYAALVRRLRRVCRQFNVRT